jgi:hypothetical protein
MSNTGISKGDLELPVLVLEISLVFVQCLLELERSEDPGRRGVPLCRGVNDHFPCISFGIRHSSFDIPIHPITFSTAFCTAQHSFPSSLAKLGG